MREIQLQLGPRSPPRSGSRSASEVGSNERWRRLTPRHAIGPWVGGRSSLPFIDATSAAGCATAGGHYVWIQLNRPSGSASSHVMLRSTPAGSNSTVNYCEFSVSQCLPKIRLLARACISSAYTTPPNPPGWSSDVTRRTQIPMRSAERQPEGCWFEFYLWSQTFPLRVFSAFRLTAREPVPAEMANTWGKHGSPHVCTARRARPERRAGACGGRLSQSLRGGLRFWLTARYFEGIDSERGIAWRASDSLSIRSFVRIAEFLGSTDKGTTPISKGLTTILLET